MEQKGPFKGFGIKAQDQPNKRQFAMKDLRSTVPKDDWLCCFTDDRAKRTINHGYGSSAAQGQPCLLEGRLWPSQQATEQI